MSKKTPQVREELFNIDREARKHYPQFKGSQPSKDACVKGLIFAKGRKAPGASNKRIFSLYL